MDKILFYVRNYDEATSVFPFVNALEKSGFEVAFDAGDWHTAELLALSRVLVINHKVYDADYYVSSTPIGKDYISYSQFKEVFS